jgi:hypothetical protein
MTQRQMPNGYRHSTISGSEIISPKTISGVFRVQRFCLFHLIVFWHIQKNQFLVASWWWCHILPFEYSYRDIHTAQQESHTVMGVAAATRKSLVPVLGFQCGKKYKIPRRHCINVCLLLCWVWLIRRGSFFYNSPIELCVIGNRRNEIVARWLHILRSGFVCTFH